MWRFAKRKHDDTKATRKYSGAPYFVHPESVAQIIQAYGGDKTLVNCGLAHDLMEDAGVTIEDLAEKFGEKVAFIVEELTNDNREILKLGKENYMNKKLENLSDEALFVKLADNLYNLLDHANESQAKRILKNLLFIKDRNKKGRIKDIYDDALNTAFYVCSKF
jgi:(p)ppGpp synthase/HD superfamily hydrolase